MSKRKKRDRQQPAAVVPAPDSYAAWEQGLPDRERRIEDIVSKMLAGAWLSGVSEKAMAQEWNLSPNTVRKMAAEASRMVRFRLSDDPDAKAEARAQVLQLFEVIRAKCMAKGDPASMRVALDALRAYGFYLGIEPARQLDVTGRTDPMSGWTTEEKLAYARDGTRPRRAVRQLAQPDDAVPDPDEPESDGMH